MKTIICFFYTLVFLCFSLTIEILLFISIILILKNPFNRENKIEVENKQNGFKIKKEGPFNISRLIIHLFLIDRNFLMALYENVLANSFVNSLNNKKW
jgi:hypothetical protein